MARKAWHSLPPVQETEIDLTPRHLTKQEFGKRLYELMIKKGWNQSDLARHAKLGRDSISTYVRGIAFPEGKNLEKLCQALGVKREDLLPNTVEEAMDREHPSMEIKVSHSDPSKCWLRINRMVSTATAAKVFELINAERGA